MISYIRGRIKAKNEKGLLIENQGLGYFVNVSSEVLQKALSGEEIELYLATALRNDFFEIYGFESFEDRMLFEDLRSIDSVGLKLAFRIVTELHRDGILNAIKNRNPAVFESVPGIGKKTASRILLELTGKFEKEGLGVVGFSAGDDVRVAEQALEKLGLTKEEIRQAISTLDLSALKTPEDIVKAVLRSIQGLK